MRRGLAIAGAVAAASPIAIIAAAGRPIAWLLAAAIAAHAGLEASVAPDNDAIADPADGRWAAATALALLAIWITAAITAAPSTSAVLAGASLFAAGVALRVVAIATLGDRFCSGARAAPRADLETAGIYAHLRHPSEVGTLCLAAGGAILCASGPALIAWAAVMVPLIAVRVRRENRQLAIAFGPRDYSTVTSSS